jgi:uncharacterized membrane protein
MRLFDKPAHKFFSQAEGDQIVEAIRKAESRTSGEIRVHLENRCGQADPLNRANEVFHFLGMGATERRNGLLIYLAVRDHQFAVYADTGLDDVVSDSFWQEIVAKIAANFREGRFVAGLEAALQTIGDQLKAHFPREDDDINELPNAISFGK